VLVAEEARTRCFAAPAFASCAFVGVRQQSSTESARLRSGVRVLATVQEDFPAPMSASSPVSPRLGLAALGPGVGELISPLKRDLGEIFTRSDAHRPASCFDDGDGGADEAAGGG